MSAGMNGGSVLELLADMTERAIDQSSLDDRTNQLVRLAALVARFAPQRADIRYSMNNSFGFGGNNCSLVFGRA